MKKSTTWLLIGMLGALPACGGTTKTREQPAAITPADADSGASTDSSAENASGCDALDLPVPAPDEGIQVSIDMQLDPGEERQICKLVLAGQDVNLNWSEGMFTAGAHHANVLSTAYTDSLPTENVAGETVDASQAIDCETLASDYQIRGLLVARVSADRATLAKGTLPDDVALKIAKNDVLELNFHMINTREDPVHACYKENLYSVPSSEVTQNAGVMFWYNSYITVPPNGTSKATMACPVTEDVSLAQQVSHMHERAASYSADLLDGDPIAGGTKLQQLYQTTDWEEPAVKINSPPIALEQGQWIEWSCNYENSEARAVAQGQQTTDEMCMFIGLYWPQSAQMDQRPPCQMQPRIVMEPSSAVGRGES